MKGQGGLQFPPERRGLPLFPALQESFGILQEDLRNPQILTPAYRFLSTDQTFRFIG